MEKNFCEEHLIMGLATRVLFIVTTILPHAITANICELLPRIQNGVILYQSMEIAIAHCDPGFTLTGHSVLYCINFEWNDTIPECLAQSLEQFEVCHFEPKEAMQCGWKSEELTFIWIIMTTDPHNNSLVEFYPVHDHTLQPHTGGHILYLDWPRISYSTTQGPAKYISPLFPSTQPDKLHCLIFHFYANGPHAGSVAVLINDSITWTSRGSLGKEWHKILILIPFQSTPFRITIEGNATLGYPSYTAIDDLKIASGHQCRNTDAIIKPTAVNASRITCKCGEAKTDEFFWILLFCIICSSIILLTALILIVFYKMYCREYQKQDESVLQSNQAYHYSESSTL